MKDLKFSAAAQFIGAAMKEKHTIIEKWRFGLKLDMVSPEPRRSLTGCWVEGCQERSATWSGSSLIAIGLESRSG